MKEAIPDREDNDMRKSLALFIVGFMLLALTGCSSSNASSLGTEGVNTSLEIESDTITSDEENRSSLTSADTEETDTGNEKILIAYFTRVGNTDFSDDIDAISSASLNLQDGELTGNTEIVASMIQQETRGELFRIETEKTYPFDYDELLDYGRKELDEDSRPTLSSHVENMDEYGVVFLGYPNWWFDMPMAVYSFLDEYDFTGKTIIPFCTHGGSGFSNTVATLEEYLPDSNIAEGFEVYGEDAVEAQGDVREWLEKIDVLH